MTISAEKIKQAQLHFQAQTALFSQHLPSYIRIIPLTHIHTVQSIFDSYGTGVGLKHH